MTRSIFDPDGGETERSGSTFGSEAAANRSHVPRDTIDGSLSEEERVEIDAETASADNAQVEDLASEQGVDDARKNDPDDTPIDEERA